MSGATNLVLVDPNAPVVVVNNDPIGVTGEITYGEPTKSGNQGTGYYQILRDYDGDYDVEEYKAKGFVKGGWAYVYAGNENLHVFIGELEWKLKYDNEENMDWFERTFQFDPNGAEGRQKQIAGLLTEINQTDISLTETKLALGSFNPHIGDSGELEGSTSLVPRATGMAETKLAVATTRNNVLKAQKSLIAKTNKLKALMSEQSRALAIKVKEIEELAKRANEAIWTINLYLGKEEEIVRLVEGKPAPAEQKITLRQEVRYMDEECGVWAEADGIDARSVGQFDDWLIAHPKNLMQVLPEDKGIAALHIRRKPKDYKDPWLNKDMNEANLYWTYLLIRNGENVYRIYIDLNVGQHLFPTRGEFENMFWRWDEEAGEKVPLKPGSKEWNAAMNRSEARQKHYMRVLLVLQGLIDRTKIFQPMPVDRINLSDPRHCDEWINLIYEIENVLTDGKPNFDEWQAEINEQIDVGCRIIGVFDYRSGVRGSKDRDGYGDESRIYPTNAKSPDSDRLYTLEDREEDRYIFRYERTGDVVYTRDWRARSHEPTVRARCWVQKDDSFILNFDAATLERLEYYQTHKLSREFYATMLPILEVAVALKREEMEQEAPFRLMLIGQIMQRYGVGSEAAEEKVDELIKWWKFKNRTHRALVGESDTKAVTMIVDEFGLRRKQEQVRAGVEVVKDLILRVVGAQDPHPVMIAHKKDNQYVAYVPHNSQNVWVTEQLWTHNRQTGDVKLKESKQWKLVDKRHVRWEILYKSDRWDSWKMNPVMSQVLTDPEIKSLVEAVLIRKSYDPNWRANQENPNGGEKRFVPLVVLCDDEFEIKFWYSSRGPIIPTEEIISNCSDHPYVERYKIGWKRTAKGVELERYLGESSRYDSSMEPGRRPWEKTYHGDMVTDRIVRKWDENIAAVWEEQQAQRACVQRKHALEKLYKRVPSQVAQVIYDREVAKAKVDFFADHGDPELWEDHLKDLKIHKGVPNGLEEALHLLVERGINPTGWLLPQVYAEAVKYGLLRDPDDHHWSSRSRPTKVPENIPQDFMIPAPELPEPEDNDNDD